MKTAWSPVTRLAAIVGLLVATAAAYQGVVAAGFVYDDIYTVARNPSVRSLARAPEWFLSPDAVTSDGSGSNLRPITVASYAVDYALWGERAAGFHATNAAIHLAVVVLVWLLARRLWAHDPAALAAAGWMALHPINAQAVNYVTARSSTLAAVGTMAAVLCYDHWAAGRSRAGGQGAWIWMAGAVGAGAFALGAKESAAVLPLLIIVWDRARFGETASWRASLTRSAPWWGLFGAWLVYRAAVFAGSATGSASGVGLFQGAAFAAKIVATAAAQSVWPVGFAIDYGWPTVLDSGAVMWSLAVVVILTFAGWRLAGIDRRMAWCAAWFGVSWLPVLALPFVTTLALYQEHRAYLAEIGVAWLVGGIIQRAAHGWNHGQWARGAVVVATGALALAAVWGDRERTAVWTDTDRLWDESASRYPSSVMARNARTLRLLHADQLDEAEQEVALSLRARPTNSYTHMLRGMVYGKRGDQERAAAAYRIALELRPTFVEARVRLAMAYQAMGRADHALTEFDRAIRDDPKGSPAVVLSAVLLDDMGRADEALQRLTRVPPDDPYYPDALFRAGALLLRMERWEDARETWSAYLSRRPDSAEARVFLDIASARGAGRDAVEAAH